MNSAGDRCGPRDCHRVQGERLSGDNREDVGGARESISRYRRMGCTLVKIRS